MNKLFKFLGLAILMTLAFSSCTEKENPTPELAWPDLTFTMTAITDYTAGCADITVVPSNDTLPYYAYVYEKSAFPDAHTPQEYAEAILAMDKDAMDRGVFIRQGVWEYKGRRINAGNEYIVIAFGYRNGIQSEVQMIEFKVECHGDPEKCAYKVFLDEAQRTYAVITTECTDPEVYYKVHMVELPEFRIEMVWEAKEETEAELQRYLEERRKTDPEFQMSDAVDALCLRGRREGLRFDALEEKKTGYSFFLYGVTPEGKTTSATWQHDFLMDF